MPQRSRCIALGIARGKLPTRARNNASRNQFRTAPKHIKGCLCDFVSRRWTASAPRVMPSPTDCARRHHGHHSRRCSRSSVNSMDVTLDLIPLRRLRQTKGALHQGDPLPVTPSSLKLLYMFGAGHLQNRSARANTLSRNGRATHPA